MESDDEEQQSAGVQTPPRSPKEAVPESLLSVFQRKDEHNGNNSYFNARSTLNVTSATAEEEAIKRAEALLMKKGIFNSIPVNAKTIPPLNNEALLKKKRKEDREKTAGKKWGEMPKVELTEELKADLRAIKLRNFIYPNRFYKANDTNKLPTYFQIGTIVTDKSDTRMDRLTKKEAKGSIAQQFLKDDEANNFSKRKYEKTNDRLRRMGNKKQQLKGFKAKNKFKNKSRD